MSYPEEGEGCGVEFKQQVGGIEFIFCLVFPVRIFLRNYSEQLAQQRNFHETTHIIKIMWVYSTCMI